MSPALLKVATGRKTVLWIYFSQLHEFKVQNHKCDIFKKMMGREVLK